MFVGADTDQLRDAATTLEQVAESIRELLTNLGRQVAALDWTGPDADSYRNDFMLFSLGTRLRLAVMLDSAAEQLRRNATDQDDTSASLDSFGWGGLFPGGFPGGLPGGPFDFGGPSWPGGPGFPGFPGLPGGRPFDLWRLPTMPYPIWGTEGEWERHWHGGEGSGGGEWKGLEYEGSYDYALLAAQAGGSAGLTLGLGGLTAMAQGSAGLYLARGSASGSVDYGIASGSGTVSAMAGAEANAQAKLAVGPDGLEASAGGELFAGAQAGAEASVEVGGVEGTAKVEGWAGLGVQADADLKVTADEVKIGINAGAAIGLGGSMSFEVSVKPKEIVADIKEMFW